MNKFNVGDKIKITSIGRFYCGETGRIAFETVTGAVVCYGVMLDGLGKHGYYFVDEIEHVRDLIERLGEDDD